MKKFAEIDKSPEIQIKMHTSRINLEKEQSWRIHTSQFQNLLQSYSNQPCGTCIRIDKCSSWNPGTTGVAQW
jgi:hypothetical protein